MRKRLVSALLAMAALPLVLGFSSGDPTPATYRFTREAEPHVQTVLAWMLESSASKLAGSGGIRASHEEAVSYFALAGRYSSLSSASWEYAATGPARTASPLADLSSLRTRLDAMAPEVERLLQDQVAGALKRADLSFSFLGLDLLLPPVVFRFEPPPNLLVISPRTRIERTSTVLLDPHLTLDQAEELEADVSRRDVSALVTPIGGLGVYPSMVPENSDIRWTLRTVAHEWAHQFLAFRPLGWQYAFGSEKDARMVTLNETVADMVGREIGDDVYRRSYRDAGVEPSLPAPGQDIVRSTLRRVRSQVDRLLAEGRVDEAEGYMEDARQELARRGYFIRKLNQAYFAFHGSYADEPSLSGPQGEDISGRIHALRQDSGSLGDFLWRVSAAGSFNDFLRLAPLR